jgi:hypothetical protein
MGTLKCGFRWERLGWVTGQWALLVVCVCLTYSFEHGAPPTLAIAQSKRLPDVTLPMVPFTKQMARAQLMTTPAARLPVAWMISSISGLPVGVVRMASGLGMQKSRTMIIVRPLFSMELDWLALSCTDADADADSGMVYLRDSANGHAGYHRDGSIPSRPWHLLSHMSYGIVPDQRKSRLQQAKHPGHAVWPAGLVCELREDEPGVCFRRCGEHHC